MFDAVSGHAARTWEKRINSVWVGKPAGKRHLLSRCRWVVHIEVDLKEGKVLAKFMLLRRGTSGGLLWMWSLTFRSWLIIGEVQNKNTMYWLFVITTVYMSFHHKRNIFCCYQCHGSPLLKNSVFSIFINFTFFTLVYVVHTFITILKYTHTL